MNLLKAPWFSTSQQVQPGAFLIQLDALDAPLPYDIKVNKRRVRVSIEISQGRVCVKTPPNCTLEMVERFLMQQQTWISSRLSVTANNHFSREYKNGEPLYLFGRQFELVISRASQSNVQLDETTNTIQVALSHRIKNVKSVTRKLLHDFYLTQASSYIPKRLVDLEAYTDLHSTEVDFKFYQWRWGCCYRSGKLRFNPLLMAAPKSTIDCVIIHELCHLKHMDHSKAFWQLNGKYCDDCGSTKKWLKQHHGKIYLPVVS